MIKTFPEVYGLIELRTLGLVDIPNQTKHSKIDDYRKFLSGFLNSPEEDIFGLEQEHGTRIWQTPPAQPVGDALFSISRNSVLFVKTADCMPIFFWSPDTLLFGVIHSGWKGTRDRITEKTIDLIQEKFPGIRLNFFLGPCIRGNEYEVKEDVSEYFINDKDSITQFNGKTFLGLSIVLHNRLKYKGYSLIDSGISNYSNTSYFSHRRGDTGRNLNCIRILP